MAMLKNLHINYIKNYLIYEIVANFENENLESYELNDTTGLDGFMSALYTLKLTTLTGNGKTKEHLVIAKFMKGDHEFRVSSRSYTQFANEVFVYAEMLPAYDRLLKQAKISEILTTTNWVAPTYVAKFGYIEGLSATPTTKESVLVLKHLKLDGYKLGPRLHLRRDQLLQVCKPLGEFHALSYALQLCDASGFEHLKTGIKTLPFINENDPNDGSTNVYRVLYRVGFDRLFDFIDRKQEVLFDKQSSKDLKLMKSLENLRQKYFAEPTRLLERLRTQIEDLEDDRCFAAILHGDYNRNNVLFHFVEEPSKDSVHEAFEYDGARLVDNVKMIDFQELRFGTPAIDLSFIMYMNMPRNLRDELWHELLKCYHGYVYDTLSKILAQLKPNELEDLLAKYSFERFNTHFVRYAFYGVMICIHFIPWLLCSESDCKRLSFLFETDLHGDEFRKVSIEAGGDDANMHIFDIIRHACELGYMEHI